MTKTYNNITDRTRFERKTKKCDMIMDVHTNGMVQIWFRVFKQNFFRYKTKYNDGSYILGMRKKINSDWNVEGILIKSR